MVWLVQSALNSVRNYSSWLTTALHLSFIDGRRLSYLWCLPVMILGSFGVAGAQTVAYLVFWRMIQGMGASPRLSIGAGVIGDIYGLEDRGSALGAYFGVCSVLSHSLTYSNLTRLVFLVWHLPRLLEELWSITGHGEPSITSLLLSHLALFSTFFPSFPRQAILEPGELISIRNLERYYPSGGPWSWTPCPSCFYFVVLPSYL